MKRAWLVLFLIVFIASGGLAWWFFRDTPEKLLRDGLGRMMQAKTVKSLRIEVAWTDPGTRVTTGFAFAGQADTKDLTRPRALGVLDLAQGVLGTDEQTADVVLEQEWIALRPRSVSADYRNTYERLVGDREGKKFAVVGRDPFLNRFEYASLVAHGPAQDVRANLPAFNQAVHVAGPWKSGNLNVVKLVTVPFRLDGTSLRPFLISLARTWNNDNPTPEELAWLQRVSLGLSRGSFSLTVDPATREPRTLEGEWPLVNDKGEELKRLHLRLDLDGLNRPVTIGIPEGAKDVTEQTVKAKTGSTLPSATFKTLPEASRSSGTAFGDAAGIQATGTFDTTAPRMINEDDVDLFNKYLEELKTKKSVY